MSIGNLKDSGNQGNNFPWQLKMLLGQQCACDELAAINANTDDVEFLLTSILTTLQEGTDYEAKFVLDTCDNDKVYLEVRVWDPTPAPGSWGPITYYIPGSSTPVVPAGYGTPGCLQYTDPTGVLGMILAELQAQGITLTAIEADTTTIAADTTSIDAKIDVNLSTRLADATFTGRINTLGQKAMAASTPVVIASDQSALPITAAALPLPTGAATETTLGLVNTKLTAVTVTPALIRTSAAGTITAGKRSVSVANVGAASGTLLGTTLGANETVNIDAGALNNTLGAIAYDATGTEFLIITLT